MNRRLRSCAVIVCCVVALASGCTTGAPGGPAATLAPSSWRFVEFQSMDDAIGTTRPEDPARYTMTLNADGTVALQLDCNRASGTWSSEPAADGTSGALTFGPLAMTRAFCPPPSMDQSIAMQLGFVRSFVRSGGRLHLALMADGGILVWEPDAAAR